MFPGSFRSSLRVTNLCSNDRIMSCSTVDLGSVTSFAWKELGLRYEVFGQRCDQVSRTQDSVPWSTQTAKKESTKR